MAVYPSAHRILADLNGTWTDLTGYVVDDIMGKWGIQGNGPLDLLADTGVLRFTLNNMDQRFDPNSASALAGWEEGIEIKLEIDYDGRTYVHLGTISDIDVPLDDDLVDRAFVTVNDWLDFAAEQPVVNPGILTNQRGDDVIRTVMGLMPIQPAATALDVGTSVFPTTFDTVTSHTKAYTELSKVAFSEPGHVYLKPDGTLVFESSHSRNGLRELSPLPLISAESGFLLKEDGGYLLKEDGGKILLDQAEEFFADNSMLSVDVKYGKQVVNFFTLTANPRRLDTSAQVLFRLDAPILISPGRTITIRGSYADPAGGLPINAQNWITPVITTDYLMNTAEDGSSTNISSDLVLVATPFGTEGFTHQLKNNSNYAGYLTKYNVRAYGIYNYNPIEHVAKDDSSIAQRGYQTETLDQKYQTSLVQGELYVERVVERDRNPRTVLNSVTFLANQSPALMMAFLNFGPGSLIRIAHDRRDIDGWFYIQGVKEFKISDGGLIMYTWILKEALSLAMGLSMVAVEFAGGSAADGINFGYLPQVSDLRQRTISAWIWLDSDVPDTSYYNIAGYGVNYLFSIKQNRKIRVYDQQAGPGYLVGYGNGNWTSTNSVIPLGAWVHVMVTHDTQGWPASSVPIIYVNGSAVALTEGTAPSGAFGTETGMEFVIGNVHSSDNDYSEAVDGKIFDVRVYGSILTAANAVTLYNGGTPDSTLLKTGLVFQAFCVRTKELAQFVGVTLTEADKLLDDIYGVVGTPHGNPVGRAQ